ncbi:hypothetical protein LTR37_020102 [Vermiconidia calcicola]|uniref:Uncharacterized protein n=1 Tax=Vermiconidia calcicola TaxID=1690605 RepID=A0ACC3MC84_9PEZI|nr:hypothetical protein LTR37_020102 [Vermiconidia calcicola]
MREYLKWKPAELAQALRQRGLEAVFATAHGLSSYKRKQLLTSALQQADEDMVIDFQQFPPEIGEVERNEAPTDATLRSRPPQIIVGGHHYRTDPIDPEPVSQMLYSLCTFLEADHKLREFAVDVQELELGPNAGQILQRVLYPLSLLGKLPKIRAITGSDNDISLTNKMFCDRAYPGSVLRKMLLMEQSWMYFDVVLFVVKGIEFNYEIPEEVFRRSEGALDEFKRLMKMDVFFDREWKEQIHDAEIALRQESSLMSDQRLRPYVERHMEPFQQEDKVELERLRKLVAQYGIERQSA